MFPLFAFPGQLSGPLAETIRRDLARAKAERPPKRMASPPMRADHLAHPPGDHDDRAMDDALVAVYQPFMPDGLNGYLVR